MVSSFRLMDLEESHYLQLLAAFATEHPELEGLLTLFICEFGPIFRYSLPILWKTCPTFGRTKESPLLYLNFISFKVSAYKVMLRAWSTITFPLVIKSSICFEHVDGKEESRKVDCNLFLISRCREQTTGTDQCMCTPNTFLSVFITPLALSNPLPNLQHYHFNSLTLNQSRRIDCVGRHTSESRLAVAQTFWHVSFVFGREWQMKMDQLQQFVIGLKFQGDGSSFSSSPLISLPFKSSPRTARNAS